MRFPPGHPLIRAARERTADVLDSARWGDTGPKLLTALQPEYAPHLPIAPRESTYAIGADEFQKFLLPEACEEVEARTANSTFVHLWNEMWRKAGVPKNIAPPKGSWLDRMFERHQVPVVWSDRLEAGSCRAMGCVTPRPGSCRSLQPRARPRADTFAGGTGGATRSAALSG